MVYGLPMDDVLTTKVSILPSVETVLLTQIPSVTSIWGSPYGAEGALVNSNAPKLSRAGIGVHGDLNLLSVGSTLPKFWLQ